MSGEPKIATCASGRAAIRRAFTLGELLVVIGVLAVLLSLLLPALNSARGAARLVRCAEQMRGFGQGIAGYANDNNGWLFPREQLPPTRVELWAEPVFGTELVWADAARTEYTWLLVCPEDPFDGNPDPRRPSRNSYLLSSEFAGLRIRAHEKHAGSASDIVVMGEKRPDAIGWTVNCCDSLRTPDPEWFDEIDLVRHGRERRSNHLFLDLHVDNRDLSPRTQPGNVNPWLYGF